MTSINTKNVLDKEFSRGEIRQSQKDTKIKETTDVHIQTKGEGNVVVKRKDNISMNMVGRLESNSKEFWRSEEGDPFRFDVDRKEVISGLDMNVIGMKIGEKRKLIIPPHEAYGANGVRDKIPPNSQIILEVELVSINEQSLELIKKQAVHH